MADTYEDKTAKFKPSQYNKAQADRVAQVKFERAGALQAPRPSMRPTDGQPVERVDPNVPSFNNLRQFWGGGNSQPPVDEEPVGYDQNAAMAPGALLDRAVDYSRSLRPDLAGLPTKPEPVKAIPATVTGANVAKGPAAIPFEVDGMPYADPASATARTHLPGVTEVFPLKERTERREFTNMMEGDASNAQARQLIDSQYGAVGVKPGADFDLTPQGFGVPNGLDYEGGPSLDEFQRGGGGFRQLAEGDVFAGADNGNFAVSHDMKQRTPAELNAIAIEEATQARFKADPKAWAVEEIQRKNREGRMTTGQAVVGEWRNRQAARATAAAGPGRSASQERLDNANAALKENQLTNEGLGFDFKSAMDESGNLIAGGLIPWKKNNLAVPAEKWGVVQTLAQPNSPLYQEIKRLYPDRSHDDITETAFKQAILAHGGASIK